MFIDQEDQHTKNAHLSQSNRQIQHNSHQEFSSTILYRPSKNNTQLHLEKHTQKKKKHRRIGKIILYSKRTSRGTTLTDLKLYYGPIVIKNHMILAQFQTDWWMESNWISRYKSTHTQTPDFLFKKEVRNTKFLGFCLLLSIVKCCPPTLGIYMQPLGAFPLVNYAWWIKISIVNS